MKKVISLFLSIIMLLSITTGLDISAYALAKSGRCGENVTWSFDSSTGTLTISGTGDFYEYLKSAGLEGYDYSPFEQNLDIKTVIINNGITSIASYLFYKCTGITSITIPNGILGIGYNAFEGCTSLTSVNIPDSVTVIADDAFCDCGNLKTVKLSENLKHIGRRAFYNCHWISDVTLPNELISIGDYAFFRCNLITNVIIGDSVNSIGANAFKDCSSLSNVIIGKSVETIGASAFFGCNNLNTIIIPDSIKSISSKTFNTLTEVTIPASTKIDFSGFDGCTNLQRINLSPGNGTMADWSLDYQDSLWYRHRDTIKEVKLEEGIKNISESAFYECTNLAKTNVPSTVESIGRYAYYGCDNLRNLTISSPQCKIPDNPNTISSFATIYAPAGSTAEKYAQKYERDFESTGQYVCENHTPVVDAAVPATCTKTGLTEGSHCSVCGAVVVAQEVVPATGHTEVIDPAVPATYTATGKTEGKHCSVCGAIIVAQKTVPKLPKKPNTLTVKVKKPTVKFAKLKK
ncbi:MAG: leucine-rich repeat domain-containing protein, partial [Eubacterium sp.]|nr:leucine-rich repeat domain-containing protein [Eubacterium sp.]